MAIPFRTAVAVAVGYCSILAGTSESFAAQIVFTNACTFSVHVPGLFGGTKIDYNVRESAIFNESDDHKFCGPVTSPTPFGNADTTKCVGVDGQRIISVSGMDDFANSDCSVSDASTINIAFRKEDFEPWSGAGSSTLRGQAFLKTVGGDVKTCAGETVILLPANHYIEELITKWKSGITTSESPEAMAYLRKSICDAQGNFSFASLPAQRWYILTQVTWGVPHIDMPGDQPGPLTALLLGVPSPPETDQQGGDLIQEVTLQAGDNQAYLTDRDRM